MAITKQSKPYEFLARWDHVTGALKGAHTQRFDGVYEDGVLLSGQPGKAMGVGEDLAFPLADILSQLQIDALAAVDAHLATIAERDATIATHAPALQALTAERDSALTRVAELEAQIAAAANPVDENGVPVRVPMAAGRIALSRAGKLAAVKAALAAMQGQAGEEAREWFEYSSHIERRHPTVLAMTPLIGTSADVDALFIAADMIASATAT